MTRTCGSATAVSAPSPTGWRFDAALEDLVGSEEVQVTAVNNTTENFGVVIPEMLQKALLGRM